MSEYNHVPFAVGEQIQVRFKEATEMKPRRLQPTEHGPGSEGKMAVLAKRWQAGQPLWHPDDNYECRRDPRHGRDADDFGAGIMDEGDDE